MDAPLIPQLDGIFQILILISVVAMSDSYRDIVLFGRLQNDGAQAILMNMNHLVSRVFIKEAIQRR